MTYSPQIERRPAMPADFFPETENVLSFATKPMRQRDDPLDILLAEDSASDQVLARKALDSTNIPYNVNVLQKGDEVLPYLWCRRQGNVNKMPDVLMLDLGLPRVDGFEILAQLSRAPASIRAVPILILTGYGNFEYMSKTYDLWIPGYLTKPCNTEKVYEVLTKIRYNNCFS